MAVPREGTEQARASRAEPGELLEWLRGREDEMCELLAELARAESPSTDARSQERVRTLLAAELIGLGHRVREPSRPGGGRHR